MHGTGQTTKSRPDHREPQADEKRQKVFCDITWEHPAEKIITNFSKPGRSLHVTEEAVYTDSSEWSCLVIDTIMQSGTTEIPPLLSIG